MQNFVVIGSLSIVTAWQWHKWNCYLIGLLFSTHTQGLFVFCLFVFLQNLGYESRRDLWLQAKSLLTLSLKLLSSKLLSVRPFSENTEAEKKTFAFKINKKCNFTSSYGEFTVHELYFVHSARVIPPEELYSWLPKSNSFHKTTSVCWNLILSTVHQVHFTQGNNPPITILCDPKCHINTK